MAYSVTSALICALILSFTLVPLLCALLLTKRLPEKENWLVSHCKRFYQPLLERCLARKRLVAGSAVAALALCLLLASRLGTEFLPELNEGAVWINLTLPTSVSVEEAKALTHTVRATIKKIPEVDTVISKTGRPEDGTDPKLLNMSEYLVDFKPESEWQRGVTKQGLIDEMNKAISAIPGLEPSFSQPIRDNILESISQIDGQIVIKLFGEDLSVLREQSEKILKAIADVPGVARSFIDRLGELPQMLVEVDRARAARYGLNVSDIQDVIESGLGGKTATELWEGEKHFDVVVRLPEQDRGLTHMQQILLSTPDGAYIPLSQVAAFKTIGGSMNIARENGSRVFAIGVFIQNRDMGSVVADMQDRVAKEITLPPGYTLSWSGEFENQQRAMARLGIILPLSILLIFVLLIDAFKSIKSAVLILLNIPFALIGGVLALFVTGIPLSVSAAIGFIALFGQAVLNGVVMVTYFNQLRSAGESAREAVIKGSMLRLRTVLMTGLLAMLGLLPMALSHGIGSETQRPLAVVVIGGLISATILTLIVLPVLYLWSDSIKDVKV